MPTPTEDVVLDPAEVDGVYKRYGRETQVGRLAASHERLRAMLTEAAERIGKQSELLSKRAEKRAGRIGTGSGV